ncbi:uncharacterized protein LOC129758092 [Uranotaenia lowii]|uniref:uncharacterized protein LOC129758092 n=1 Tax=Uranotaenia lowii TaxID=190385 RepID=UPI0024796002|nr:uncharacterized protein LOC129758092 [Uranotaenia lowii]
MAPGPNPAGAVVRIILICDEIPRKNCQGAKLNAKSLDPTNGYWAEALPAMETPLCAVLDPVRDFRWHALRCGGPETAAFLCELPVPNWAADCTITSLPSLTVQYLSDSGAVQLSRDCGEQGTRHMSCQGKLERDAIMQQLQCSDEEQDPLGAQTVATENNQLPVEGSSSLVTRKPQQPQQVMPSQILEHDILTVVSSNDEDNNIDVNPNQIEDTVKNVINKFNLADLIQSEQGLHSEEMGEAEKESKKALGGKKYSPLYEKKEKFGKKGSKQDEDDELMQGDQPDETETQPIDIVQQAVKPTEGDSDENATAGGSTEGMMSTLGEVSTSESTTEDSRLRRATDSEVVTSSSTTEQSTTIEPSTTTESATSSTTSSHILPTTPKKEVSSTGDHFIPPMLMVKARFIATKPHSEVVSSTTELVTEASETPSVISEVSTTEGVSSVTVEHVTDHNDIPLLDINDKESTTEVVASTMEPESTTAHQIVEITFDDKDITSKIGTLSITTRPFIAEQTSLSIEDTPSTSSVQNLTTPEQPVATSTNTPAIETSTVVVASTTELTSSTTTTTLAPPSTTHLPTTTTTTTIPTTTASKKTQPSPTPVIQQHFELHHEEHDPENTDHELSSSSDEEEHEHHQELHNSFSNIENYQPYKPNRHRSLTKPEVHNNHGNYIKKILG